jgi:ubiquinone/menaquinone biosynthesis C-methylase UbiE
MAEKYHSGWDVQISADLYLQESFEVGMTAHDLATLAEKVFADGRADEALVICAEALKRDPDEPLALNNKAVLLAAKGETKEAIDLLQRAVKISPNMADAHNNLDSLLASLTETIQQKSSALPSAVPVAIKSRKDSTSGYEISNFRLTTETAGTSAEHELAAIAARPLFPMQIPGEGNPVIFTPGYSDNDIRNSMTEQFRDDADIYAANSRDESKIRQFLSITKQWLPRDVKVVLDLCAGAGADIVPLVELYPEATIIATDLSLELLCILKKSADKNKVSEGVVAVQLDASEELLVPGSADLVVGFNALHHIIEPVEALTAARRALGSGGVALFYEPLAVGYAFLAQTHRLLLADPRARRISQDGRSYLERMVLCWETMLDPNKSRDAVRGMDDKWCFPRPTFERYASEAGFSSCRFAVPKPVVTFTNQTLRTIPLAITGADRDILPDWCWTAFNNMDRLAEGPLFEEMASNVLVIMET